MTKMYLFIILFLLKFWVFKSLLYSPDGANIVAPCELLIMNAQTVASKKKKKFCTYDLVVAPHLLEEVPCLTMEFCHLAQICIMCFFFSVDDFLGVSSLSKY